MKKLLIGLLVLVIIIAVASTVFLSNLDGMIKDTIEAEGTAALGSTLTVESVETDLRNGSALIKGMSIANVSGYTSVNAIEISTLKADVDYQNQLIKSILIDEPVINADLIGTRSNFEDLVDNMPVDEEITEDEVDEGMPEITINSFSLNRAKVNVSSDKLGQRSFIMDDFVITGLVGTPEQIADIITVRLTSHVSAQVKNYATQEIKALANEVKRRVQEEVNEKVNEKINDTVKDKLGDKVKGLKFKLGNN
ncbi:MAG TPA: hypothetical protein DCW52_01705 [Gammaproteobacteria bacterium]|nr:hypothetical protein [Gammaproteobacteria bacterium]